MRLVGDGMSVELPRGWEGQISRPRPVDADAIAQHRRLTGVAPPTPPTAHLANFALPPDRGDFGSGAVDVMTEDDAFVALVEYGPDEVDSALFAAAPPSSLTARDFHPRALQRTLSGQSGHQSFFTINGRAFCLYAVLGRDRDVLALVRQVNAVLAGLRVDAR